MSTTQAFQKVEVPQSWKLLDDLAQKAADIFGKAQSFSEEIAVAQAMQDLREALTPEVMKPITSLMHSKIGFDTDRNPAKARQGERIDPYPPDVIRDCVIEAKMRGMHVIGSEFCIIAGGFYAARNGLKRMVRDFPGVSYVKLLPGIPKMSQDGKGAIVPMKAFWTLNGKEDTLEIEIPVKMNAFMGADGAISKAERKTFKRILDIISGQEIEDEPEDLPQLQTAVPISVTNGHTEPAVATEPAKPAAAHKVTPSKIRTSTLVEEPLTPEEKAKADAELQKPKPSSELKTPTDQDRLSAMIVGAGFTWSEFYHLAERDFGNGTLETGFLDWSKIDGFAELPAKCAAYCLTLKDGILDALRRAKV